MNKLLEIDGELRTINEWARIAKINASTIHSRINAGWQPRDAVYAPIVAKSRRRRTPWRREPILKSNNAVKNWGNK